MALLWAVLIISFEAIGEGLIKKYNPEASEIIFDAWLQWVIALFLFGVWMLIGLNLDGNYIPGWKMVTGFIFIRFAIFDVLWNLARGVKWNYYGYTKLYDRTMLKLGSWGWFAKAVLGIIGICFLMGWQ